LGSLWTKPTWPVSPTCVKLSPTEVVWPVSENGLVGLGCQHVGGRFPSTKNTFYVMVWTSFWN
jgi:hypothetical protein